MCAREDVLVKIGPEGFTMNANSKYSMELNVVLTANRGLYIFYEAS